MELPSKRRTQALRAMRAAHPADEETTVLKLGNVTITTKKPSFWNERQEPPKTYGQMFDTMLAAANQKCRLDEEAIKNRLATQESKVALGVNMRDARRQQDEAEQAWKASKTPEAWERFTKAQEVFAACNELYEARSKADRELRDATREAFGPVGTWVVEALWDFRFDIHYDCDED